jgi:hypothetical protein
VNDVRRKFAARKEEVELYLSFLSSVQNLIANGQASGSGDLSIEMTPKHQQVLHASVFLHLYNLVESTVTWCIEHVEEAVSNQAGNTVGALSVALRKEWVKAIARTSEDLNPSHRLEAAMVLCGAVLNQVPPQIKFAKSNGGNWDDDLIAGLAERIGFSLTFSRDVYELVKRPVRNDMGVLKIVKKMRNDLAHGSISFAECGADLSVSDLAFISGVCLSYLEEFIDCVDVFVLRGEFLDAGQRQPLDA